MRTAGLLGGQSTQARSQRRTHVSGVAERYYKALVGTQRDDCRLTGSYLCGEAVKSTALVERSGVCGRFGEGLVVKGCPRELARIAPTGSV